MQQFPVPPSKADESALKGFPLSFSSDCSAVLKDSRKRYIKILSAHRKLGHVGDAAVNMLPAKLRLLNLTLIHANLRYVYRCYSQRPAELHKLQLPVVFSMQDV